MSAERNIVWIASYPKSGNTWMRFMGCNLIYGRQDSAAALNALAPDIHELRGHDLGAHTGFSKTHFVYSASMPHAERTAAVIYIVRRPADVLVSNYHYEKRAAGGGTATRADFDRYFELFMEHRGDPKWIRLGMGTWEENVRSWLDARHPFPVFGVRYEDLSADPKKICIRLANFLQLERSEQEIDQTVSNSSFERLREIETADIRERRIGIFYGPFLQSSIDSGQRFMRKGTVGDGERLLTPEQRARLVGAFAEVAAELGYPS